MDSARRIALAALAATCLAGPVARGADAARLVAAIDDGGAATVGDRLPFALCLDLQDGMTFEPQAIGPDLGPFVVVEGAWAPGSGVPAGAPPCEWRFDGTVSAYETGALVLPAVAIAVGTPDGVIEVASEPLEIPIVSVLGDDGGADAAALEVADLKAPVSIPPDHGPLRRALAGLAMLLALAGALWWAHRRYASRLRAAPSAPDPFLRMAPHEWAFRELEALLARRLQEGDGVDVFHAEVSRILKRYLGGRYRVELMERTTAEIAPALSGAGAPEGPTRDAIALLVRCDAVKFAGERPHEARCRDLVEASYRLVDATRPAADRAEEGAA